MFDIFLKLADIIAPPQESVRRVRSLSPDDFKRQYQLQTIDGNVSLSDYQRPNIKAAITANKFYNNRKAARLLGSLLYAWVGLRPTVPTLLIPIPLSAARLHSRGYNQVSRIIETVDHTSFAYSPLLERTRDTTPQTTLARTERLKNMVGAFSVKQQYLSLLNEVSCVVIVDDVMTTGATLRAARAAVQPHLRQDQELITLALAH